MRRHREREAEALKYLQKLFIAGLDYGYFGVDSTSMIINSCI